MSVKVNIIDKGEGIEIIATGIVSGREIINAHETIYDDEHIRKQKYHIIDKSKCTEYSVTATDIEAFSELDKKASLINSNIIIAVIESETLEHSLTNLWQAHVKDHVFKTCSFTNRNNALEWIENKLNQS